MMFSLMSTRIVWHLLINQRFSQIALEHSDGDNTVDGVLGSDVRLLRQDRVAVTGQSEKLVVCIFPGFNNYSFEHNFIDNGILQWVKTKRPEQSLL